MASSLWGWILGDPCSSEIRSCWAPDVCPAPVQGTLPLLERMDLILAVISFPQTAPIEECYTYMLSDSSRKLDVINARLLQLDMKVDSKPGYPQSLAIGVASGALLQGFTSAAAQIWTAVRRATNPGRDSPIN
ncbi:uncharacterized protein [Coffea arabica]|uniref:Uncharacterized protein n=1 Tax=Coffea arabica TaxID=13443 RepID=A0ABM4VQR1_COFAR